MELRGPEDASPLLTYTDTHLWGNPEENQQYQVALVRVTSEYGIISNFSYMNKWRVLPKRDTFFHVFSVGGLEPGYWDFMNHLMRRNPLDRWVNAGWLSKLRGIQLDVYTGKGYQYSRSNVWIMKTYDGLTLIALEKLNVLPIPAGLEVFFRCYTPSVPVDTWEDAVAETTNPFVYETMTFESPIELAGFMSRYQQLQTRAGFTGVFHNGVYFDGAPNAIPNLGVGDVVEIWHDPTVIRTESYQYKNLQDFYSDLDQKRKLILHPPREPGNFTVRYFDDNDYYLLGTDQRGLYFPRNDVGAIRQLTHVDVSIADDMIQAATEFHPNLKNLTDITVFVLVRKTAWEYQWPHEHQRIRYLYRMPDADIMKVFTGERGNLPEWTANGLETGAVMGLARNQWKRIKKNDALLAVGYNAATRVVSEMAHRVVYDPGARGIEVPVSYRDRMTAWEYDANGLLLGYWNYQNTAYFSPMDPNCAMVEFVLGNFDRKLEYTITNQPLAVSKLYGHRVFLSNYDSATGELVGDLIDVPDDGTYYDLVNGTLVWKNLPVTQRAVVFSDRGSLAYTFALEHIDHSLAFALTDIYVGGGLIFPFSFAEVDIWLNGHPLIDNVDWIFDNQYCYIINKEFLVDGPQTITVRAYGYRKEIDRPNTDTELGFVDGGVIGRFARYNLRTDRVTRTVIGGSLFLTDEVPRAERSVPDGQWSPLNGLPYMVKHSYTPLLYVKDYENYPYRERSRDVDQRVSDYLTLYLPKPATKAEEVTWEPGGVGIPGGTGVPSVPILLDKYRLYSPFLNVVVNGIVNQLITVPDLAGLETIYANQAVYEAVKDYLWWLKYDPINLRYDRRYFAIAPFANFGKVVVTSRELLLINQANELYLDAAASIEGYFLVDDTVR